MDTFEKVLFGIGAGVLAIFLVVVVCFISAIITEWAWNYVMPYLFHLPHVTFWQAFALNLLVAKLAPTVSNNGKSK